MLTTTHLGHSAVLVEVADRRVLLDPGTFSDDWHELTDLDAVLITHSHPDHVDAEHLRPLLAANPGARVWAEPSVPGAVDLATDVLEPEDETRLGDLTIRAVGGQHALIHVDIPRIGNVGFVLSAPGEATFFHPGDSLSAVPSGVDLLALPAHGPWAAMREHVDFARAVGAERGLLIHEGLLNERGVALCRDRMEAMTPLTLSEQAVVQW